MFKNYLQAFRSIAANYSEINHGLIEDKDYWYDENVGPYSNGMGFSTDRNRVLTNASGNPYVNQTKPTIHLSEGYFVNYLKNPKAMWSTLVRAVYHEFIHVRLMLGLIDNLPKVETSNRSNNVNHEITAYYFSLSYTSKTLPSYTNEQKINIAKGAIKSGYEGHGIEKPKEGPFSIMYEYILNLSKPKK
jgi:hypothetical protein